MSPSEEQFLPQQDFLNSVLENIPNMIFVKDAKDLRFVRFNRAGEEFLGYSRNELLGKCDYDFFPKDQADYFTTIDRAVLNSKTLLDVPFEKLKTKNHGEKILHTRKIPILGSDGEPQFLLGISEDITEKVLAEERELRLRMEKVARDEAEKSSARDRFLSRASALLSSSLDYEKTLSHFAELAVSELADWCSIETVNERGDIQTVAMKHRNPEKIKFALEYRKKFPPGMDPGSGIAWVLRTGQSRLYDDLTNLIPSMGNEISPEQKKAFSDLDLRSAMLVPIKNGSKVTGCIVLISAESGRIYSYVDLSVAEELASRAALAIDNAKLYRTARDASQAKTDFLANMSHEIRTPLGAVMGYAELILGSGEVSEKIDYMMALRRNGDLLLHLIDDLLDLSKVEAGHLIIEKEEFSFGDLLMDIESFSKIRAREKGVLFHLIFSSTIPEKIISDSNRLRQILLNIIGNAVKFTNQGSVEVEVKFMPTKGQNKGRLEFIIQDSGVGISAEQAHRLFQPFVQADTSTTRKFGGTGLGLALSQKLARALKGDVRLASSHIGQGSSFIVELEIEFNLGTVFVNNFQPRLVQGSKPSDFQGLRGVKVLVVEDSPDNQILISTYLKRAGAEVDVAKNGLEGVLRASSGVYNVILMDIQMPVLDGYAAMLRLRNAGSKIPIIVVTAHALEDDRKKCFEFGCHQYLTKPINRTLLVEAVHQSVFTA